MANLTTNVEVLNLTSKKEILERTFSQFLKVYNGGMEYGLSLFGIQESDLKIINEITQELKQKKCEEDAKGKDKFSDIEWNDSLSKCTADSKFAKITSGDLDFSDILDFLNEIIEPTSILNCVNPKFQQFLNYVPLQFFIAKWLEGTIFELFGQFDKTQYKSLLQDITCNNTLQNILDKTDNELRQNDFEITLPKLPRLPVPDFLAIVEGIIIESICLGLCVVYSLLLANVVRIMNRISFSEFENTKIIATEFNKFNLNLFVRDELLIQANNENLIQFISGNQKQSLLLARKYFDKIHSSVVIDQRDIILLLVGESNCAIINELKKIGSSTELSILGLNSEQEILSFFKFLGNFQNISNILNSTKRKDCLPSPCDIGKIDENAMKQITTILGNICEILEPSSGLPSIPMNNILKATGLDTTTIGNIKNNLDLLYLEYKRVIGTNDSISNTKPKEHLNILSHNKIIIDNKKIYFQTLLDEYDKEIKKALSTTGFGGGPSLIIRNILKDSLITISDNYINGVVLYNKFVEPPPSYQNINPITTDDVKVDFLNFINKNDLSFEDAGESIVETMKLLAKDFKIDTKFLDKITTETKDVLKQ